jgi:hypothetical protein
MTCENQNDGNRKNDKNSTKDHDGLKWVKISKVYSRPCQGPPHSTPWREILDFKFAMNSNSQRFGISLVIFTIRVILNL